MINEMSLVGTEDLQEMMDNVHCTECEKLITDVVKDKDEDMNYESSKCENCTNCESCEKCANRETEIVKLNFKDSNDFIVDCLNDKLDIVDENVEQNDEVSAS